ncbi:MAG TPA: discoidin domain-containing protein [Polyangiaceae bacterium]|nr:discoidin domain-containing protein [Polyangiaceae bacterium]
MANECCSVRVREGLRIIGLVSVVAALPSCGLEQSESSEDVGEVAQAVSSAIVLKSNRENRYVVLQGETLNWSGGCDDSADAAQFVREPSGSNFRLKSVDNGKYVKLGTGSKLVASATTSAAATLFKTEPCGSQLAILADKNGDGEINGSDANRYVKANTDVEATSASCSSSSTSWEKWELVAAPEPPPTGCAAQKLTALGATASSVESSHKGPEKAIDGNLSTRWSSQYSDPQWISVDFGGERFVHSVTLRWETAASAHYDIRVSSDGSNWTTVFTEPNGNGGTDEISGLGATARYVQMFSHARTTQYGNSLFELEVFGDLDPFCASPPDDLLGVTLTANSGAWNGIEKAFDGEASTKADVVATQAFLEFAFDRKKLLQRARLWEDNSGFWNVEQWNLDYWNGTAFVPAFPLANTPLSGWNEVDFDDVVTDKVRLNLTDGSHIEIGDVQLLGAAADLVAAGAGQVYLDQCGDADVPIPPVWNYEDAFHGANGTQWVNAGVLDNEFISGGLVAEVFYYQSANPQGVCIALPRSEMDASNIPVPDGIQLLGVICQGTVSSAACFWDGKNVDRFDTLNFTEQCLMVDGASGTQYITAAGKPCFIGGTDLAAPNATGGTCTDCHRGENAFILHPATVLGLNIPNRMPDDWYDPIVDASWPQNPGPTTLLDNVPDDDGCLLCHNRLAPTAIFGGRFPELSSGDPFCNVALTTSFGRTMPHPIDPSAPPPVPTDFPSYQALLGACGL